MNIRAKSVFLIFSLVLIFFTYDCLASELEYLKPSTAVTKEFEQSKINKDYNYYYGGSDTYPTIIFALEKDYLLENEGEDGLWRKLDLKPDDLAYLVLNMQMRGIQCCGERPQGFEIFASKSKKVGIWYSILAFAGAPLVFKEGNKVAIYPPRETNDLKAYEERNTHM